MGKKVDYFLKLSDLLTNLTQSWSSLRTCQQSEQEDWIKFSQNLPKDGLMFDGQCYRLRKLERVIEEKDGSCLQQTGLTLPTLTVRDASGTNRRPPEKMSRAKYGRKANRIPSLQESAGLIPLPNSGEENWQRWRNRAYLSPVASEDGVLNPQFAEEIMGYEIGWTELGALEMRWFQHKPKKHSKD